MEKASKAKPQLTPSTRNLGSSKHDAKNNFKELQKCMWNLAYHQVMEVNTIILPLSLESKAFF